MTREAFEHLCLGDYVAPPKLPTLGTITLARFKAFVAKLPELP